MEPRAEAGFAPEPCVFAGSRSDILSSARLSRHCRGKTGPIPKAARPSRRKTLKLALAPGSSLRHKIFLSVWVASLASNFGGLIQSVGAAWMMSSIASAT